MNYSTIWRLKQYILERIAINAHFVYSIRS